MKYQKKKKKYNIKFFQELKNIENVETDCVIELKSENSRLKQNYQIIKRSNTEYKQNITNFIILEEFWNLKEENKNLENLNLSNIQKFEKVNNQALSKFF